MSAGKRWLARLAAWALFGFGVFVFIALPTHRYDWMQTMAPSLAPQPDDASGNGAIFALLLLLAIVASQLALMTTATSRRERLLAVVLALTATVVWALRL